MDKRIEKKIVLKGRYEDVVNINDHLHLIHKKTKICVLPYTISSNGIIDKIGVVKETDILKEKDIYSLINGNINQDDGTNIVAANRILYEIIGSNIKEADNWIYLGILSNISIGNNIIIYAVNISDIDINQSKNVQDVKTAKQFDMIKSNKIVSSDDALFLATYLRLFNHLYVSSLNS